MEIKRGGYHDGGYPPGVTGNDPHFDLPNATEYRRGRWHRACRNCRRGPHPVSNRIMQTYCGCPKCVEE